MIVLVGAFVAQEYSWGVLATTLGHGIPRPLVLLAKAAILTVAALAMCTAAVVVAGGASMLLTVMMGIMILASVVTGSGNAAFFAFSPLLPEAAASVGIKTLPLAMPVQLSAGLARTMSPIAGVIIAVAGIAGVTPFDLIRRTTPVMIGGLVVTVVASLLLL